MCRAQCVLVVVAISVGVAHSWDFAVSLEDQLIFYTNNGTETDRVHFNSQKLGGLAYDEVHNMMLYVDKQNNSDIICGYDLYSKENECFIERSGRNILSIAYDPATEKLFFTDANEKSINWISLKRGSTNNIYGNLLIKMDDRTPDDIAVDSCGGYIYWTKTKYMKNIDVERVRFDGSRREVLYDEYHYLDVISLTIDPQTKKIFFIQNGLTVSFLCSAEMSGRNIKCKFFMDRTEAKELTSSKDYVYYMTTTKTPNMSSKSVWRFPKNARGMKNVKELTKFYTNGSLGIVANYKIEDQINGIQDCNSLSNLIPKVKEAPGCTCERCDVCVNYCFQGNCSVNDGGLPECSCDVGYSGKRCEVNVCHGYCLNAGECFLNEEDEPDCQCAGNHEGARCEADVTDTTPTYD